MKLIKAISIVTAVIVCLAYPASLFAKYEYALSAGKGCVFCHADNNGGPLKDTGLAYIKNGYKYPIPANLMQNTHGSFYKFIRFLLGYLHIIAAVLLGGAIFYVHVFIGPSQLTSGIPKNERKLGLVCLATLAVTGVFLTCDRIGSPRHFFDNTFGIILFIKIMLFVLMITLAVIAVTYIHRRMKEDFESKKSGGKGAQGGEITRADLSKYNGEDGRPAYVLCNNVVFDVSGSAKWKGGRHFGKHSAGTDLTEALKGAPHDAAVLERVKRVGEIAGGSPDAPEEMPFARRIFVKMAFTNFIIVFLIFMCVAMWHWGCSFTDWDKSSVNTLARGSDCAECHSSMNPVIYKDWKDGVHAKADVDCYKCHKSSKKETVSADHLQYDSREISAVVSPLTCAGCHSKEYNEYARSKHANTTAIMQKVDKWIQFGVNNSVERTSGCYACHGTEVVIKDGKPVQGTWPNVGVGRRNPDGSLGSCTSCHTRHIFSAAEARKPEACGQCHLGPDHPQIEIYNESKHGAIYSAQGRSWNWSTDDGKWKAGRDYRAPTCSACHMSGTDDVSVTHDTTERLSWELQSPLTIRPSEFKAWPAGTDWQKERDKMKAVCMQCHSQTWTDDHYNNLDRVVSNYNETYYKPVETVMNSLYSSGLAGKSSYFDDVIEWEFYEFWHHEGRRARMGAAMMAPDYSWWHGFYELKHRYVSIMKEADRMRASGRGNMYYNIPGRFNEKDAGEN